MTTPDAANISSISLIRTGSMTHAFDENERFQFLSFTKDAGKVTVQAPANANLAPPGPYMLFLVDSNGVPSVARSFAMQSAPVRLESADRLDHRPRERQHCLGHDCASPRTPRTTSASLGVQFKVDRATRSAARTPTHALLGRVGQPTTRPKRSAPF